MYVVGPPVTAFTLVLIGLLVPFYFLFMRFPNRFPNVFPSEKAFRPPRFGAFRRSLTVDVSDEGVLVHGPRAQLMRWRDLDSARITNEWLELRFGPRLVVLPQRAFSSAVAYEHVSNRVASEVPIDPQMEAGLPTYLALGDSYTIGESVAEGERFPVQLADALRRAGRVDLAAPRTIATTGWTTDELAAGIEAAGPVGSYDLVTLLIGVNNQYRGRGLEEYREQFRALLNRAISFAGGVRERVTVISIPDWGVTPFADGRDRERIADEIDAFNSVNWDEANREGARYVDITPISRRADEEPGLIAKDGLHPSGEMYRLWVEAILPEAVAALAGG